MREPAGEEATHPYERAGTALEQELQAAGIAFADSPASVIKTIGPTSVIQGGGVRLSTRASRRSQSLRVVAINQLTATAT